MGTLKVAVPLESTGLKLSPMPSMEPSASGRLMACGVAALASVPPGSEMGVCSGSVSVGGASAAEGSTRASDSASGSMRSSTSGERVTASATSSEICVSASR
ncbi:MAG: hypothetical protein SangKO_092480 [Sandaracinaceae bacterium]